MAKTVDKQVIYAIIKEYLKVLKANRIRLSRVYLFGSYAKKRFDDDSDIDLALVSDDFKGDIIQNMVRLMKLRRSVDLRIEPHPFVTSEFDVSNPFVNEIIKSGEIIL